MTDRATGHKGAGETAYTLRWSVDLLFGADGVRATVWRTQSTGGTNGSVSEWAAEYDAPDLRAALTAAAEYIEGVTHDVGG